jgi:type I restriction enzyme S subunit
MRTTTIKTVAASLRHITPYPTYRDSGVAWLGKIPAHWDVKRLKFASHIEAGQSPSSELVTDGSEGLPFLQGNADFGPLNPTPRQVCDAAPKKACAGDILLSVRAPVGAMNIADQAYGIGRGLCAIRPTRSVDPTFLFYLLIRIRSRLDSVATGSTYDAVTTSEVGDLPALLPPQSEQRAIAAFLDRETAKIDSLVAKKERLIQLLEEKRTVLISRAVTKGLNSDVSMKDAGVEWLGKIPAHWEVVPLKRVLQEHLTNGLFKNREAWGSGSPIINVVDLYRDDFSVQAASLARVEVRPDEIAAFAARVGDVFFVRSSLKREGIGSSACLAEAPEPIVFECHLVRARPNPRRIVSRYLVAYLNASIVRQRLVAISETTTMTTIAQPSLETLEIVLPSEREQQMALAWLDLETAKIDTLVAKVREATNSLKELRATLISAAVTGKIDVRGEVA